MGQTYLIDSWDQAWPPEQWTEELREQIRGGHTRPFLVHRGEEEYAYVEIYEVLHSNLAEFGDWTSHDLGFHIAVVDHEFIGRGIGSMFVPKLVASLFRQYARARRVVGEPNIRNVAVSKVMVKAGMNPVREIELPHKTALLHVATRPEGSWSDPRLQFGARSPAP
ncbi:GNAT family N-acetyltransferase [Streptomyces sp. NPDC005438]|uniref:GNAT family N-acetyltransferase n=1 Tax=Streptomyces sp. NPDC005438 TaxID=3156880 RepID=UPI0033AB6F71